MGGEHRGPSAKKARRLLLSLTGHVPTCAVRCWLHVQSVHLGLGWRFVCHLAQISRYERMVFAVCLKRKPKKLAPRAYSSRECGRHPTEASQVVANPRRAADAVRRACMPWFGVG